MEESKEEEGKTDCTHSMFPMNLDLSQLYMDEILLLGENLDKEQLCVSVVWDWMHRGVTEVGISREVIAAMNCG
jgi:hypothetical protein